MRQIYNRIDGVVFFLLLVLVILAGLVVNALPRDGVSPALLVALAAALTGALLGFIFAVPRRIQGVAGAQESITVARSNGAMMPAVLASEYDSNTSLEEICDWLTKIIVGVGLVEATEIGRALDRAGRYVGVGAFGKSDGSAAAATLGTATIVAFGVIGFLMSFLWFRQNLMIAWSYSHVREPSIPQERMDAAPPERVQAAKPPPSPSDMPETASLSSRSHGTEPSPALLDAMHIKYTALRSGAKFPDDWLKDMFGGKAATKSPSRKVNAVVTPVDGDTYFQVVLEVSSSPPATGQVVFFLHNTFPETAQIVSLNRAGSATLKVYAWGAFTVGVLMDDGETELELDLATLPGVPERFAAN